MDTRRLSKIGEIALVMVLVAGTGYLAKLLHHNYVKHADDAPDVVRTGPRAIPARDASGARAGLALEGRENPVLLMVLRVDCQFCEKNMPNWTALAADLRALGDEAPEMLVLSQSEPAETEAYLVRHGLDLPVRYIDGSVMPLLGLRGVPSTLAVDPGTRSLSLWDGVLGEPDREAILAWSGMLLSDTTVVAGN